MAWSTSPLKRLQGALRALGPVGRRESSPQENAAESICNEHGPRDAKAKRNFRGGRNVQRHPVTANDLRGHERGHLTNGKEKYLYKERLDSTIRWPAVPIPILYR